MLWRFIFFLVSILYIREKEEEKNQEEKKREEGICIHALSSLTMTRQCRLVLRHQLTAYALDSLCKMKFSAVNI